MSGYVSLICKCKRVNHLKKRSGRNWFQKYFVSMNTMHTCCLIERIIWKCTEISLPLVAGILMFGRLHFGVRSSAKRYIVTGYYLRGTKEFLVDYRLTSIVIGVVIVKVQLLVV